MQTASSRHIWQTPLAHPLLGSGEVHVWRAALDMPEAQLQQLQNLLADDEIRRAERFFSADDRNHFIAARGLLRTILGRYLNRDPQQLCFSYGERGKPALEPAMGLGDLRFNLAHSHGLALYAVTARRDVGIDLERIRSNIACEQIAQRFFAAPEAAAILAAPAPERLQTFFAHWTIKEAYIKALGQGLWQSLDGFTVVLDIDDTVTLTVPEQASQDVTHWSIRRIFPHPEYAAAVAAAGQDWQLVCWQWHSE